MPTSSSGGGAVSRARKAVQRGCYSFLVSRSGAMLVFLVGALLTHQLLLTVDDVAGTRLAAASLSSAAPVDGGDYDNIGGVSSAEYVCSEPIDAVYTWVNGSDPDHIRQVIYWQRLQDSESEDDQQTDESEEEEEEQEGRGSSSGASSDGDSSIFGRKGKKQTSQQIDDQSGRSRFEDHDELLYSLRSLETYAPWVRRVFIVTNGQVPSWLDLDANPRVKIITHAEIFPVASDLPTFSSPAIESNLHRIPGLSRRFLYLNDDTFFGSPVVPDDFYSPVDGFRLYFSWPVPQCADGCPPSWISDGYCDRNCNTTECAYDGGDCIGSNVKLPGGVSANMPPHRAHQHDAMARAMGGYCASLCADNWIGDGFCDAACNKRECAYDGTDCGMNAYYDDGEFLKLTVSSSSNENSPHQLLLRKWRSSMAVHDDGQSNGNETLTTTTMRVATVVVSRSLHVPDGTQSFLVDLSSVFPAANTAISAEDVTGVPVLSSTITSAHHETPSWVRTAAVSQQRKALVLTVAATTSVHRSRLARFVISGTVEVDVASAGNDDDDVSNATATTAAGSKRSMARKISCLYELRLNISISPPPAPPTTTQIDAAPSASNSAAFSLSDSPPSAGGVAQEQGQEDLDLGGGGVSSEQHAEEESSSGYSSHRSLLSIRVVHKEQADDAGVVAGEVRQQGSKEDRAQQQLEDVLHAQTRTKTKAKLLDADSRNHERDWRAALAKLLPSSTPQRLPRKRNGNTLKKVDDDGSVDDDGRSFTAATTRRRLLDMFGDSLKHGNNLMSSRFGSVARKVPAHMVHLIDRSVVEDVWREWPEQWRETSASKFRSKRNMQFAFMHYYYVVHAMRNTTAKELFAELDMDKDGAISVKKGPPVYLQHTRHASADGGVTSSQGVPFPLDTVGVDLGFGSTPGGGGSSAEVRRAALLLWEEEEHAVRDVEQLVERVAALYNLSLTATTGTGGSSSSGGDGGEAVSSAGSSVEALREAAAPLAPPVQPSSTNAASPNGSGGSSNSSGSSGDGGGDPPQAKYFLRHNPSSTPQPPAGGEHEEVRSMTPRFLSLVEWLMRAAAMGYGLEKLEGHDVAWADHDDDEDGSHSSSSALRLTERLFAKSHVAELLLRYYGERHAHSHIVQELDEVTFVMVRSGNATVVRHQMDHVLVKRPKFLCINDDMDHSNAEFPAVLAAVQGLLRAYYPHPSSFELKRGSSSSSSSSSSRGKKAAPSVCAAASSSSGGGRRCGERSGSIGWHFFSGGGTERWAVGWALCAVLLLALLLNRCLRCWVALWGSARTSAGAGGGGGGDFLEDA